MFLSLRPRQPGRRRPVVLWFGGGMVVLAVGATLATAGIATGGRAAPANTAVPKSVPAGVKVSAPQNVAQVQAYWTPQRMAAAKNLNVVASHASTGAPAASPAPGTAKSVPGYTPANLKPDTPTNPAQPIGASGASPQSQCYQCFIPFTRYYYFARYRTYPASTVGKLFFTEGSSGFVCSASTNYTDTVMTAGHCVYQPGVGFNGNELFCPSYNAGVNPAVGCWAANSMSTSTVWANTGSFEWDTGGINTSTCGTVNCTHIANVTGYLGLAWNQAEDQNWYDFGYPQAAPFNGNYLTLCNSEFGYEDSEGNNQGGPNSLAIGCDMTGGSSGGPFILGFGGGEWLNGHNDWKWNSLPNAMQTPYYTTIECQVAVAAGRSDISSC